MKYKIICLALLLFGCASFTSAQDETPTSVTVQNRTGDLPFSQTVGTGVEHVDIGSGNLIVDFPIISLPGRHMPFNYGLRYNALFWTVASRTQTNGAVRYYWAVEKRPYIGGDNGLGFSPTLPQLSWGFSTETCTNVNGTPPDTKTTATGYMYTDAGGGKHQLPILQVSASSPSGNCFMGQDGTGFFQGFVAGEGILAVAPDIYSTPAIYLPDGTQVAWPTDNSILNPPVNPDFWVPIGLGQYLDANGNSKCEPGGCFTVDTLGRNPLTIVNGSNQILYQVYDSDGVQRTYTVNLGTISVHTNFGIAGVAELGPINRTVVSSIVLPNGTSYSFQYENGSYGGLTGITLPTGATINYTWATLSPSGNPTFAHRYVSGRTVTVGSQVSTWTFSKSCVDSYCFTVNTDLGDPLGNHTLYQHSEGKVVFAKIYNGAVGSTLLRQYDVAYSSLTADPNALPIRITTKLENGLQSKVEYDYDTTGGVPGNVSEIREFDYAPGAPGALLRRKHKTYGLNTSASYLAANIVDRVTQESVYDSTGDTCRGVAGACAQTQYEYDNYVAGDNPLQSTSSAAQHDYTGHSASFTPRGNLTRVKRWRNTDGAWLNTTYSYDDLGNIRSIKDPLGHSTSYDYADSFANANCLPPSGTSGQAWGTTVTNALGQQMKVVRFPCTGLVQAHRDQNDIDASRTGTTYTYDQMGRQLTKNLADGGQSSAAYNDTPPVSTTTTTKITSALNLTSTAVMDGLGRNKQAQLTSDPAGTDYTDTTYDLLGRIATVNNPYRSTSDPTYGVTQTQYDALSRPVQVTRQDGSISTVTYSANCTTATDEAGKQRKSCVDALGRMNEVDEPGDGTSGTVASGGLTITGTLQTKSATSATSGAGSVTISGAEQSKAGTPSRAATANITVTGSERSTVVCAYFLSDDSCGEWDTIYDVGTVTINVNGHLDSVSYGQGSTPVNIATALASAINSDASAVVNGSAANGVLSLTARQTGTVGNSYSWALSSSSSDFADFGSAGSFGGSPASGTMGGGANAGPTVYDHGTCTATINGTAYSKTFGQGDTTGTIAAGLASTITAGTLASATASGTTISVTAKTSGASTNYSLSSSCSYDSANFTSASFTAGASGSTLIGGTNGSPAATDAGTLAMSLSGYSVTANYGNGTGQDSTASAIAADLVGKIQALLPGSNPPFTIAASGANISINWSSAGTAGNVTVTTTSTTTQTAYFATPSFANCSIAANPQGCSTTLSGGVDPVPPSLNSPYVTLYAYDALGNLLRVDQKGSAPSDSTQWRTRLFTHNSLSQLLTANNPESGTITYSYDNDGELLQKTSPAPNQTGTATQTVSYCYDALHRVTGKGYGAQSCPLATPVVTYAYDSGTNAKGHLTSLTDQAGTASYTYDILGRLATETRTITGANNAAISKNISYTYNLDGSVKTLTYPSGNIITYAPDSAGRMLSAVDSGSGINYVTGATYGPDSALTGFVSGNSTTFAGITNAFTYNKRLQPVAMSANAPTQTVFSIGYDFHVGNGTSGADNGNVFGIFNYKDTTHGRDQTFTYDALNRLASAQNTGTNCSVTILQNKTEYWGNAYTYDAWGNLLQKTVTKCGAEGLSVIADAHNWIHASGGSDYLYDAAGNMTFNATPPTQTYTYDQENRLTGAAGYAYTYDGDGNRVRKSNGNLAASGTLYWSMTPGVVAETDLAGTLKSEYVFFDGERVARRDGATGTAGVFYYFSDHLKTASVITDSASVIKAESDYYPWGGELQFVNNDSNDYKFTGKKRDIETGLDYFGARYYSNGLGRWVSADWSSVPIPVPYADFGDPQSLNLYGYVRNIPTSDIDQDGHGEAWQMKQHAEQKWAKMSPEERKHADITNLMLVGGGMAFLAGGEIATPLARGLYGLFLATAPTTVPIGEKIIDGLTPGPPSPVFSAERAAANFGFKTVEKAGSTFVGQFGNGASVAVNLGMVGSEMKATMPMLSKLSAETLRNVEKGAVNAAKGEGATSLTITAKMASDGTARILSKQGFTQIVDAAGKKTSDWVKTLKIQ